MTDDEVLDDLRAVLGGRWHIWHDPARGWCALPLYPPFGDPVIAPDPVKLAELLEDQPR